MGYHTTCSSCGATEKGYHPGCDCAEKETARNVQRKQGTTILEVFLEDDQSGLYLYERLRTSDFQVFCLRTCLRSMGSGEYEDLNKVVEISEEEMLDAIAEDSDWPGLTDLAKDSTSNEDEKSTSSRTYSGVDELDEEGAYDDEKDVLETDTRMYIFEELSDTKGRFRRSKLGDNHLLFIPVRYLEEERENKASMGWDYSTTTQEGEYWIRPKSTLTNPFTSPMEKDGTVCGYAVTRCSLPTRPADVCTANKPRQTCTAHSVHTPVMSFSQYKDATMPYSQYPWTNGGWNRSEDIEYFFSNIMHQLYLFEKPVVFLTKGGDELTISASRMMSYYNSLQTVEEKIVWLMNFVEEKIYLLDDTSDELDLNEIGTKNFLRYQIFCLMMEMERGSATSLDVNLFFRLL